MNIQNNIKDFFVFDKCFFLFGLTIFPFLVIFGTLSHEFGHIVVAKLLGYETILHYGSMNWFVNGIDGENLKELRWENFLITLGGVLQTIITGTIGLFVLLKTNNKKVLIAGVCLALFWSREVINLLMGLINGLFFNKVFFGGDELKMSQYFNLPNGFFSILLGLIGVIICLYVFLKIPIKSRFSFFVSGFLSGSITYFFWFQYLGPIVLP